MAGPKFNWDDLPSAEPAARNSSKFDWDSLPSADASPKTGAVEAGLESFGNAATLGYLPHAQALIEKVMPNPNAEVDAKLRAQGFDVQNTPDKTYVEARDANIARQELQKKEHPVASGVGTGAGILASAIGTGGLGAVAKGATGAQRLAAAAKAGGALGALANPGDVEGEFSPAQPGDRLKNAGTGAVLGVAGQGIAEGAGFVAQKGSKALKDWAGKKAFRALGRANASKSEALAKSGRDIEIGRELLDSKTVPVFGSTERIAKRVDAVKDKADDLISDILAKSGKGEKVFDSEAVAIKLLELPELKAMRTTPGMESVVKTIEESAETLAKNGKLTLEQANQLKRDVDKSINFNKKIPEMAGKQEGLFKTRTAVRDEMNDLVNKMNPGQERDALLKANRRSGDLATAQEVMEKEIGREQRNRMFSITDYMSLGSGAYVGETPEEKAAYAIIAGVLNKGARKYGNAIQARGADSIANQLAKIPKFSGLAEKNPAAFSALIERMTEKVRSGASPMQPRFAESEKPKRGEALWMQQGVEKLGLKDTQVVDQLLKSNEGKRLLIEASDLPQGSKGMKRIMEQIHNKWGYKDEPRTGSEIQEIRHKRRPASRR